MAETASWRRKEGTKEGLWSSRGEPQRNGTHLSLGPVRSGYEAAPTTACLALFSLVRLKQEPPLASTSVGHRATQPPWPLQHLLSVGRARALLRCSGMNQFRLPGCLAAWLWVASSGHNAARGAVTLLGRSPLPLALSASCRRSPPARLLSSPRRPCLSRLPSRALLQGWPGWAGPGRALGTKRNQTGKSRELHFLITNGNQPLTTE